MHTLRGSLPIIIYRGPPSGARNNEDQDAIGARNVPHTFLPISRVIYRAYQPPRHHATRLFHLIREICIVSARPFPVPGESGTGSDRNGRAARPPRAARCISSGRGLRRLQIRRRSRRYATASVCRLSCAVRARRRRRRCRVLRCISGPRKTKSYPVTGERSD